MLRMDTLGVILRNEVLLSYKSVGAPMVVGFLVGSAVGRPHHGSCSGLVLRDNGCPRDYFFGTGPMFEHTLPSTSAAPTQLSWCGEVSEGCDS